MAFGFYHPNKGAPTTSWIPSTGPEFPLDTPVDYSEQLTGETAGGTLYVQDKGPKRERFNLQFTLMSQTDRDNLETFFNTVKKSFNVFEYEDGGAVLHSVRWMNEFNIKKDRPGLYSGSVLLRKETS